MKSKISTKEAIQLLNSDGFESTPIKEGHMPITPRVGSGLSRRDDTDINQRIINKLMSISKALADEFGFDQKEVMMDMINDMRIAGGEEIFDLIKGDSPIENMTKEMAMVAREIGMNSNVAIQALLRMDEKQSVEMFRQFLNQGQRQLPGNFRGQRELTNNNMKFLESLKHRILLDEGLDDIYAKYYSDLGEKDFNELIALDPTFDSTQDKLGTYGKWILARFKQKSLTKNDFRRVHEILSDFEDRKRYITTPNGKDIFTYKTIGDVRQALDNIELTANQVAKQNRKAKQYADLGEEAEFIGENNEWEIWSPKTYAASCKLGSGTTWCTASTSSEYQYKSYTSRGKLYIFLSKPFDVTKKYQAHVDNNNKITAFMDYTDRPSIDFSTFVFENDLLSMLKKTELKHVDAVMEVENMERVNNGEPYIYVGGTIKAHFRNIIKHVIVKENTVKDGTIPPFAFKDCVNVETVKLPADVVFLSIHSFDNCDKVIITSPNRRLGCFPGDIPFLKGRIKVVKGTTTETN